YMYHYRLFSSTRRTPRSTLFPYTTLFRSKNMWRTSALFATMGNGLPGAIAAKADFPDRQAWNLAGDGAFAMVMQDIVTAVQYERSEEHTSELQSRFDLVFRLLLEKIKI